VDNPTAARDGAKIIYDGCESLVNSPHRGRKGKQAGTRELVFSFLPYIAAYRVVEDIVVILHIWHGAWDRR
jgi:plasmid stabilization system protein ParE